MRIRAAGTQRSRNQFFILQRYSCFAMFVITILLTFTLNSVFVEALEQKKSLWQSLSSLILGRHTAPHQESIRNDASDRYRRQKPQVGDPAVEAAAKKEYDYIVIGGGAAGCPLSRTLADAGKEVLLIERGGTRKEHPDTLDIYGAGWVIGDSKVSQLIQTTEGVRSHIGSVLSGGTAINMAIVISEVKEYFDYLQSFPGVSYDMKKLHKAIDWITQMLGHPMPESAPYGQVWRRGLEKELSSVFGPNIGPNIPLSVNNSWDGFSLFDSKRNFYRNAADVTLGKPGVDFPETLSILLRHTVQKIVFEREAASHQKMSSSRDSSSKENQAASSGELVATCVVVHKTSQLDVAPIVGRSGWGFQWAKLKETLGLIPKTSDVKFSTLIPKGVKQYRMCLKPGGTIISSAGAILTPILMYKSGVGPKRFVANSQVELVKEFPDIGKGLRDRVLIPVNLFFKEPSPPGGFPPSISQAVGLANIGSKCSNFKLGDLSMDCSTVPAEQLSGARIAEGTLYSTRLIFPPNVRNDPFFTFALRVIQDCSYGQIPMGNILYQPICIIAAPIGRCFRRVISNFSFVAQPKSLAELRVEPDGVVSLTGNYLKHPQDLQDAMRGLANIIRVINLGQYEGVIEQAGLSSCPVTVLNGLVRMLNSFQTNNRNTPGLSLPSPSHPVIAAEAAPGDLSRWRFGTAEGSCCWDGPIACFFNNQVRDFLNSQLAAFEKDMAKATEKEALLEGTCQKGSCENANSQLLYDITDSLNMTTMVEDEEHLMEGAWFNIFGWDSGKPTHFSTSQKFATYPIVIPEPSDEKGLKEYTESWITSIWHWVGSTPMGVVVDSNFKVKGFKNLAIVDASVLNQVTRMNPTVTVMALGRYAGQLLLESQLSSTS